MCDLYAELHAFHVQWLPDRLRNPNEPSGQPQSSLAQGLARILASPNTTIFVAEASNQLVGLAEVRTQEVEPHPARVPRRYGHLQSMVVAHAWRRSGLGAKLIETVERWARNHGASELQLDLWEFDAGPLPFYEALGYRTLKRTMVKEL